MALFNLVIIITLLAEMTEIEYAVLMQHYDLLSKHLSDLGDYDYDDRLCAEMILKIPNDYYEKIGIYDKDSKKHFNLCLFKVIRKKWKSIKIN